MGTCSPSPGTPEHQGERPDGASLWKGCRLLLKKIAFVLQLLLLLVWPWVSAVNEILRKVWRKMNTFLGSEARNLESSGQKPVHFYFGSQLLLDLLDMVPSQSRLPAISGVLSFFGDSHCPGSGAHRQMGQIEGNWEEARNGSRSACSSRGRLGLARAGEIPRCREIAWQSHPCSQQWESKTR